MSKATVLGVFLGVMSASAVSWADPAKLSGDEKAIQKVIEEETQAFRQRDVEKALSYWAKKPYASHSYTAAGTGYLRGFDKVSGAIRDYIAKHPEVEPPVKQSDYIFRVNGNAAWVTYIQQAPAQPDGKVPTAQYQARYVEKLDGAWKIVAVVGKSAEVPPTPAAAAASPVRAAPKAAAH